MTKKHWAYLAIALGLAMIWSLSQLTGGEVDGTTTLGKLETDLATFALTGAGGTAGSTTATTPWLAYGLLGVGAWMLF